MRAEPRLVCAIVRAAVPYLVHHAIPECYRTPLQHKSIPSLPCRTVAQTSLRGSRRASPRRDPVSRAPPRHVVSSTVRDYATTCDVLLLPQCPSHSVVRAPLQVMGLWPRTWRGLDAWSQALPVNVQRKEHQSVLLLSHVPAPPRIFSTSCSRPGLH